MSNPTRHLLSQAIVLLEIAQRAACKLAAEPGLPRALEELADHRGLIADWLKAAQGPVNADPVGLFEATREVGKALADLISAVEQHHATNTCASDPLFAEANRAYNALSRVRWFVGPLTPPPEDLRHDPRIPREAPETACQGPTAPGGRG